jgi:hypothetical protein
MMKDCFRQEFVDAQKYRECAECPIYDECTRSVSLKNARGAETAGKWLGAAVALVGLSVAIFNWGDMPHGAPWLLLVSAVYALAVFRAAGEQKVRYGEFLDEAHAAAEAGGAKAQAPAAHGHH